MWWPALGAIVVGVIGWIQPVMARVGDLIRRVPVTVTPQTSARAAADVTVREGIGRLVVVASDRPRVAIGVVTRSDLLEAHERRLRALEHRNARWACADPPAGRHEPCH